MTLRTTFLGLMAALSTGTAAAAQELPIIGAPQERGLNFQPAATQGMRDLVWLDNFLLVIITVITIFVAGLLVWLIVRYNQRANPEPASFTHNTPLEVAWTVVPIVILIAIGSVSLPVLFRQQTIPAADVHIKVTGYQWYWGYEYTEHDVSFESFMVGIDAGNRLTPEVSQQLADLGYTDDEFLLATDTTVVIPTGKTIVMSVTAADVIHSWTIPAFGVKQDGVPGRLAQLHFTVDEGKEGIYFGQCSELCGLNHAYMPITVMAVDNATYEAWIEQAQGGDLTPPARPMQLASN